MRYEVITDESIRRMVEKFYGRVRQDSVLGPVFEEVLHDKWDDHIARIAEFWSTIILRTGSFQGNVFGKHMALDKIREEHFVHWLSLFRETISETYCDDAAKRFLNTADRIAGSLQLGFFNERTVTFESLGNNPVA